MFSNPRIIALLCFHLLLLEVGYSKYTAPWFYTAVIYMDLQALPQLSVFSYPAGLFLLILVYFMKYLSPLQI